MGSIFCCTQNEDELKMQTINYVLPPSPTRTSLLTLL